MSLWEEDWYRKQRHLKTDVPPPYAYGLPRFPNDVPELVDECTPGHRRAAELAYWVRKMLDVLFLIGQTDVRDLARSSEHTRPRERAIVNAFSGISVAQQDTRAAVESAVLDLARRRLAGSRRALPEATIGRAGIDWILAHERTDVWDACKNMLYVEEGKIYVAERPNSPATDARDRARWLWTDEVTKARRVVTRAVLCQCHAVQFVWVSKPELRPGNERTRFGRGGRPMSVPSNLRHT